MSARTHKRRLHARQLYSLHNPERCIMLVMSRRGKPVPIKNAIKWAQSIERMGDKRQIGDDMIAGYRVSTVFLGLDHGYLPWSGLRCFETMVFAPKDETAIEELDYYQERFDTMKEAEAGHARIVAMVRATLIGKGINV